MLFFEFLSFGLNFGGKMGHSSTFSWTSSHSSKLLKKLEKSKKILEGLALEDYDMIAKNARSLRLLSREAGWKVIQTEEYATQSRDFRRTCDLIAKAAEDKEIGRAALGYVALTVRCVECHAYMRKHKADIAHNPLEDAKSR